MIVFKKNSATKETQAQPVEENRFEQIRKTASEQHKKSDTDGTRRRDKQTAENNRLI